MVIVSNLAQWLFAPQMINSMYKVKEITKTEDSQIHDTVERLSKRIGLKMPKVMMANMPIPNAFAYGSPIGGNRVAVTKGLLKNLQPEEVEAVLGHELGHLKNKDVQTMMFASVMPAIFYFLGSSMMYLGYYGGGDRRRTGGAAPILDVPGGTGANVLDPRDMKELMAGRPLKKGGLGSRFISWLGALFMRYAYEPSRIRWLLRYNFPFKKRVAIIGGGFAGCELGITLVESGKNVAIIEESKRIGYDVGLVHRWVWMKQLREAGTRFETNARIVSVNQRGVEINRSGENDFVEANTVVLAGGLQPNTELTDLLSNKALEFYSIGDCSEPGKLLEAVAAGFLIGHKI